MPKPRISLYHGDCLDVMRVIPDGSVDMVFADLPYGVTANKWDVVIPFDALWSQLLRIGKKNAAFIFTSIQPFATALVSSNPSLFRYDIIWEKTMATGFLYANCRPMRAHDNILIFTTSKAHPISKLKMTYNPQMVQGEPYVVKRRNTKTTNYNHGRGVLCDGTINKTGERHPRSVVRFKNASGIHPTQKPVALLEWLIKTYSNPGDTILDPVMGSGTTGVACINTGRNFVGIEKDAAYYAVAKNRIQSCLTTMPHPHR